MPGRSGGNQQCCNWGHAPLRVSTALGAWHTQHTAQGTEPSTSMHRLRVQTLPGLPDCRPRRRAVVVQVSQPFDVALSRKNWFIALRGARSPQRQARSSLLPYCSRSSDLRWRAGSVDQGAGEEWRAQPGCPLLHRVWAEPWQERCPAQPGSSAAAGGGAAILGAPLKPQLPSES